MELLIELTDENGDLPHAEAAALGSAYSPTEVLAEGRRYAIIRTFTPPERFAERLSHAKSVSEHLGSFEDLPEASDLPDVPGPVYISVVKAAGWSGPGRMETARELGYRLGKPVSAENPRTVIKVILSGMVHVGLQRAEVPRDGLSERLPHLRPFFSPVSMLPKLARCAVNLSSIREGQTLLDPFCGTGGILIEAALMGIRVVGSDISQRMVEGCRRNLMHYTGDVHDIRQMDISDVPSAFGTVDAVVTDVPYGRASATGGEDLQSLYARAMRAAAAVLPKGGRAVLVVPQPLTKVHGMESLGTYPVYIHRGLTRYIMVLRKL